MQAILASPALVENCVDCQKHCQRQDRTKLVAVKRTLYNPHLTTFKKAEIETHQGKLSDEHSRTTLPKAVADLPPEVYFNYNPSCSYIPRYDTLPLPTKWIREHEIAQQLSLERNEELKRHYLSYKGNIPFRKERMVQIPQTKNCHFLNYKIRYLRPEERQKWREHVKKPQPELPSSVEATGTGCLCKVSSHSVDPRKCIRSKCDELSETGSTCPL
ncbi:uncharacterized protein LOC106664920 [Cimex lectularius]|uniref:Uncharacterized protein n=1 Tax=Cimex lectularius TaxID=79782 RepID=A0A8I6RMA6_CIMLE|nr:uncharacterized protein LOC106664920 [Cimex lectularius]